jgi:hypothetical protein
MEPSRLSVGSPDEDQRRRDMRSSRCSSEIPMVILPGQDAPLGRPLIGGLLFAPCATRVFVPTMFAFEHARAPRTSAGARDPSAIPAGA